MDTRTSKQRIRAVRQDELREKLSTGGHLTYAVDLIKKIEGAKDKFELDKYNAAFNARMKLVNKYLPELKATELTGEGGERLEPTPWTVQPAKVVDGNTADS